MGVYISGMEMPRDGNETIIRIQPDGTVLDQYGHLLAITAVPVPPHGRLIDADAIPYNKIMIEDDDFYYGITQPRIERMPTIIPAEEGE